MVRGFDLRLNSREFETHRPLALPGNDLGTSVKAGEVTAGCGRGVVYRPQRRAQAHCLFKITEKEMSTAPRCHILQLY